jgi:hypothetical protein
MEEASNTAAGGARATNEWTGAMGLRRRTGRRILAVGSAPEVRLTALVLRVRPVPLTSWEGCSAQRVKSLLPNDTCRHTVITKPAYTQSNSTPLFC